jgi:hypothetical protein
MFLQIYRNKQRWLFSCLFIFIYGCSNAPAYTNLMVTPAEVNAGKIKNEKAFVAIEHAMKNLQQGDLVMRTGNDFTSEMLQQLCLTDKTYSHCGIVVIENDSAFVYHALGGDWNPDEKLRKDPFDLFCNPYENRGFGIFRFDLQSKEKNRLDSVSRDWYKKGLQFDMKFDLTTNDRLYCAEFITKAVEIATNRRITFSTTNIKGFQYEAPDNLFLNQHVTEKIRITF